MKWNGKTQQEWYDYIDTRTVDNYTAKLLSRIVDNPTYKFDGEPSYANLRMQNKPSLAQFEAELELWKPEARAKVDAAFADIAAKDALRTRMEALKYPRVSATRVTGNPNGLLVLKLILDQMDDALLTQIEAEDLVVEQERQASDAKRDKKAAAQAAISGHLALVEGIADPNPVQAALKDILILLEE